MSDQPDGLPDASDVLSDLGLDVVASQPPPADPQLREMDHNPSDTPEATEIEDGTRLISADVSCSNCAHRDVCVLLSAIGPLLGSWNAGTDPEASAPIDLTDLAVICDAYAAEDE